MVHLLKSLILVYFSDIVQVNHGCTGATGHKLHAEVENPHKHLVSNSVERYKKYYRKTAGYIMYSELPAVKHLSKLFYCF